MNRLRLRLATLAVITLAIVAGCGSTAVTAPPATPGPSASVPAASAGPSQPPISTLAPSLSPALETEPPVTSEPSGAPGSPGASEPPAESPAPTPEGTHAAPDLEAMLPGKLNETALTTESDTGDAVLDAWTRVMVTFLDKVGKAPADLELAQAYDATSGLDVSVMAFRLKGIPAADLQQAVSDGLIAGSPALVKSVVTLSGKEVTKLASAEDGWNTYLYPKGDVVYIVGTSDETLATTALSTIP